MMERNWRWGLGKTQVPMLYGPKTPNDQGIFVLESGYVGYLSNFHWNEQGPLSNTVSISLHTFMEFSQSEFLFFYTTGI